MEEGRLGFIKEALRGILKCLGLESGGGKDAAPVEGEVVNNSPPPLNPTAQTTYESLPSVDDPSTTDPLVEVLTLSIDNPVVSTRDIGGESNFSVVTIDEIMNTSGGTTAEAHYVELLDNGKTNMSLLATRLISSGGGGKNH